MNRRWKLAIGAGQLLGCMLLASGAALRSDPTLADETSPAPAAAPAPASPTPAAPAPAAPAPAAPAPAAHISGTWQKHQYSFQYMGFTTTYSCDGLADKLKVLLIAAGARADAKAQPGACAAPFGRPDKFARADLTFYTLAPLAGGAAAGEKPVDAQWRAVTFGTRSPRELAIGDCEAVEQFKNLVLPMFTTRNVVDSTACIPYQFSGSVINLQFEALAAVKRPGAPKAH